MGARGGDVLNLERAIAGIVHSWTRPPGPQPIPAIELEWTGFRRIGKPGGHVHIKEHWGLSRESKSLILSQFESMEQKLESTSRFLTRTLAMWVKRKSHIDSRPAYLGSEAYLRSSINSIIHSFANEQGKLLNSSSCGYGFQRNVTDKVSIQNVFGNFEEDVLSKYVSNASKL